MSTSKNPFLTSLIPSLVVSSVDPGYAIGPFRWLNSLMSLSCDVYRLSNGLNCKPETFLELIGAKDYSLGIKVEEGLVDLALKQKGDFYHF